MAEDVRRLPGDRRATFAPDELPALERRQPVLDRAPTGCEGGGHGTDPEDLPDDRRGLDESLLVRRKGVQPGGDDPLDGLRKRKLPLRLHQHANVLLCVKRIPARSCEQPLTSLRTETAVRDQ